MPAESVSFAFYKGRSLTSSRSGYGFACRLIYRYDIHAINSDTGNTVADGSIGNVTYLHTVTLRNRNGIQVVFADKNYRQAPDGG